MIESRQQRKKVREARELLAKHASIIILWRPEYAFASPEQPDEDDAIVEICE